MPMRMLLITSVLIVALCTPCDAQISPGWLNEDFNCPLAEEISPCFCGGEYRLQESVEYTTVECFNKTMDELKQAFKSLNETRNIKMILSRINLEVIRPDIFEGIDVTRLHIFTCDVNVENGVNELNFIGLEDCLEELIIWRCGNLKLNIGHLQRLKRLSLSENNLKEVDDEWFGTGPTALERLYMDKNELENLGDHAFANLSNLKSLYITRNKLSVIKRTMFPTLADKLNTLVLNDNSIQNLPEDIFNDMPALEWLYLEDNKITKLENNTWFSIWTKLDIIDLRGNPLNCDSHMNWMFEFFGPFGMSGQCASPKNSNDLTLRKFINTGIKNAARAK